jgi:L-amino acid N-acyltransferase YncA
MQLEFAKFSNINLGDEFFDSLKSDYAEFESWFNKKSAQNENSYIAKNETGGIEAFLYLKQEEEEVSDVKPALPAKKRVKVGTFKINPHGTKLGERFIKKIFDHAIGSSIEEIYVTIFPKHAGLYSLLKRYGFEKVAEKPTANGVEDVLLKDLSKIYGDVLLDYPKIIARGKSKFVLSIYPNFHTRLFPDSILNNESYDIVKDVSHTNSINKVYISFMDMNAVRTGDIIVIYRTSDQEGRAWFRSVATSVCVVTELKTRGDFSSLQEYLDYCAPHSVFNQSELTQYYNRRGKLAVIKMTYNAAFSKRLNRKSLIEDVGLNKDVYWGFFRLTDPVFQTISKKGGLDESLIVY